MRPKRKKKKDDITIGKPKRTVFILIREVSSHDRDAFKSFCALQGFSMSGLVISFMQSCAKGEIDCKKLKLDGTRRKPWQVHKPPIWD